MRSSSTRGREIEAPCEEREQSRGNRGPQHQPQLHSVAQSPVPASEARAKMYPVPALALTESTISSASYKDGHPFSC